MKENRHRQILLHKAFEKVVFLEQEPKMLSIQRWDILYHIARNDLNKIEKRTKPRRKTFVLFYFPFTRHQSKFQNYKRKRSQRLTQPKGFSK